MAKEIKKWKTLETKYLIRRPWLTARVDKVQLPDGRINPEHYVLEYPDWVNVTAITKDGKFVMIRQYRHAFDEVLTELCTSTSPSSSLSTRYLLRHQRFLLVLSRTTTEALLSVVVPLARDSYSSLSLLATSR